MCAIVTLLTVCHKQSTNLQSTMVCSTILKALGEEKFSFYTCINTQYQVKNLTNGIKCTLLSAIDNSLNVSWELVLVSTRAVEFSFNNQMYKQLDGVAMGSPLGPELANIFVGFHESRLFDNTVKPGVYFRIVDDTFAIFGSELDCDHFKGKLNVLHPALKFTVEKEQNNALNFPDVLVEKDGTGFLTSIYRKPTFTGQYIHWNTFSPKTRKISLIKTLVHRALMICSKTKLGSELDKIKQLLIESGYPADVQLSCINQKLANFAAEKRLVQRSAQST